MWFSKKPRRSHDVIVPDDQSSEPTRVLKPKHRVRNLVLGILVVVLCLALAFVGFYIVSANMALSRIKTIPSALPSRTKPVDPRNSDKGILNYVLLGTESRGGDDPGRSDTLMLAHVNKNRDKVYLISFPRDLYVQLHGGGMDKINAAYAYHGPAGSVGTLEDLLGIHVDHVAAIDLNSFVSLTDAIGGVDVFNPVASRDHNGFCYPYGDMHVEGRYAVWFTRQRHGLPSGDFDRAQRQRIVTKAILAKLMKPETLLNPTKFLAVTNKLADFIQVDESLTPDVIRRTALSMRVDSSDDIVTMQAPVGGFGTTKIGGLDVSIIHVDRVGMQRLGAAINNDTMDQFFEAYGNITNGMAPTRPDSNPAPKPSPGASPSPSAQKSTQTQKTPTPVPSEVYCQGYNRCGSGGCP